VSDLPPTLTIDGRKGQSWQGGAVAGETSFDTAIGVCAIAWTDRGIRSVRLPGSRPPTVGDCAPPPSVAGAIARIVAVLEGGRDDLRDVPLDLDGVPDFDGAVYDCARKVGPGHTTTYGAIATRLGAAHAAREVGQALARNPVPLLVPCHRVLGADGRIGGFSAPGGVQTKLRLLAAEDAVAPDAQGALF
jgi:methylated-DNA-[protein]-cysteine S-methyltransferase